MATFDNMVDGRYRLEVELGRGGFGAVYRAKQLVMGRELRDVALKLFHEGAITPDNVLEKMNDAISLIRVLGEVDDITIRQHFIDVYDLGVTCDDEPQAFIAMELVRGGDLRQRTRDRGKLNVKATMHYLLQITRAIGFMHSQPEPMLHRDLKPDNLLLARRGGPDVVKIADFGLAQALDDAGISYQAQKRLEGDGRPFDFLIGDDLLLEVDGVYWHSLPGRAESDGAKTALAEEHGYRLLRVTDEDIAEQGAAVIVGRLFLCLEV